MLPIDSAAIDTAQRRFGTFADAVTQAADAAENSRRETMVAQLRERRTSTFLFNADLPATEIYPEDDHD